MDGELAAGFSNMKTFRELDGLCVCVCACVGGTKD